MTQEQEGPVEVEIVPDAEGNGQGPAPQTAEGEPAVDVVRKTGEIDLQAENVLSIMHCYSCKGPHEKIPVYPYMTPHPPYTHYYICPSTGDPTGLAIVPSKDGLVEVNGEILALLSEAQQSDSFMIVVYWHAEGRVQFRRQSHKFPTTELQTCKGMILEDFEKQVGPPAHTPLQEVEPPKPTTLFSDN